MAMHSDVQVVESSLVTPCQGTPRHQLWLSTLDLLQVNRGRTPIVYFYRPAAGRAAADGDFFDVTRLKESLARALVAFYPLAGRLGLDSDGRFVIDCNAQGALLVVARSDLAIADIGDLTPSPELKKLFLPRVEPSSIILATQVTFLKCGVVAFGTALHHAAGDATSAFHFFRAWSALCRAGATVEMEVEEPPCHDRSLLRARSPPFVSPDAFAVFCPKLNLTHRTSDPVASKVFTVSESHVAALKRACGVSTFCALSAHVWRCVCVSRGLLPDATTRLTLPASVRRRIKPPVPDGYFGNAIIWAGTSGLVCDVVSEGLEDTAGRIREAVRGMDDEVVRSAIDYFELAAEEEKDGRPILGDMPETELRVISWLSMPVYDADYGWGTPEKMVRAESERSGFVYLMNNGGGSGGVQVVLCAEAAIMDHFEELLYVKLSA